MRKITCKLDCDDIHTIQVAGWRSTDGRINIGNGWFGEWPELVVGPDGSSIYQFEDADNSFTETDDNDCTYEMADYRYLDSINHISNMEIDIDE